MVKFQQITAIVIFFFLITSIDAFASTLEENVIEVKGQASVTTQPDYFSLMLSIAQKGRNTSKLRALVDHKSNQVINIAESLDIPTKNINSARVILRVIKDRSAVNVQGVEINRNFPQQNKGKVYVGVEGAESNVDKTQNFELSRTISINFSTIDEYDEFLSRVIKVGVTHISPLSISVTNSEKTYQQALAKAIDNAKTKAHQIASQANIKLGKLVYLKELSTNHYQRRLSTASMYSEASVDHRSHVTDKAISASVLVKFAIKE
ncbi:MAG: SIMPL domain-containing protein [Colwellia sp.]|nr:SIMPL domain-containing protein [Colwellia sp.]MCW8865734.1 SIMPL domain-containing protein [Colwellia sp.]MCW9080256.1 SIMPL domain-containing protein [Colwellia sp.]